MSAYAALRATPAFDALRAVSERLGRDPLQVQGPGGNTSLKADGAMWVKASGTWLAEARERDIMVPVDARALGAALKADDPAADEARHFVPEAENAAGLRPSIETTLHAILDWPAVIHTHCVATIAVAVREDAQAVVDARLSELAAVVVPYAKPGLPLTRAIRDRIRPETQVIVLGNHGLIVGADTPENAETLLRLVSNRLEPAMPTDSAPQPVASFGAGWRAAPHPNTQSLALDARRLALARGGTLYPDHAIFLGPGVAVADAGEDAATAATRAAGAGAARKLVLVPDRGAALPEDASPSVLALARALGDVVARIPAEARLRYLTAADEADLLDWDAEKYRQALEAERSAGV